jgi:hypothetical protein
MGRFVMKKNICKLVIIFECIIFVNCISHSNGIKAIYEKKIYDYIFEQMYDTAKTFFFDIDILNRFSKEDGLPIYNGKAKNTITDANEIGGLCEDYSIHFVTNYEGPGEVFLVGTYNNKSFLGNRVKEFEKNDILASIMEFYIEELYSDIDENYKMRREISEEGTIWKNDGLSAPFYTKKINGIIYWSEEVFNPAISLTPFTKELIKLDIDFFYFKYNEYIDKLYNSAYQIFEDEKLYSHHILYEMDFHKPFYVYREKVNSKIISFNATYIPKIFVHLGLLVQDHMWVRIIYDGKIIDVDPTWYDTGNPLGKSFEIIK